MFDIIGAMVLNDSYFFFKIRKNIKNNEMNKKIKY